MNNRFSNQYIAWRFYAVICLILLAALGLSFRVFDLAILNQFFLRHQGDERVLRLISTPAFRGIIVDRNGFPLAVSTKVFSIYINPKEFQPNTKSVNKLATALNISSSQILKIHRTNLSKKREFAYLKRKLSPQIANQIRELNIAGVYTQEEYQRFYPEGESTAQLLGITNIDDKGQEGLELAYDQWLQGEQGKKWVIKDRLGRVIADVQEKKKQTKGHDLVLSIDRRLQYIAYRELLAGVDENQAVSGSAIVLDVKTGEVLAMVNVPSFNPNIRTSTTSLFRNRAVTDAFEPGSTIKTFTVANALLSGKYNSESIIDTNPGWMRIGKNLVIDHNNYGKLTPAQILQHSSNVGVTKMMLSVEPDSLWNLLKTVGFGEITNVGFPGEQNGSLIKRNPWGEFILATMSFGYGLTVTELQLAAAYAVIANNGYKIPVTLIKVDKSPQGVQVINSGVSKELLAMLESVLTSKVGTGKLAKVSGYRVGGKTGTSQLVGSHGYEKNNHMSSFVGIAPVSNPRFVVAVVINDPKGKKYYGGEVSGPVFSKIMEEALRLYDIAPDDPQMK